MKQEASGFPWNSRVHKLHKCSISMVKHGVSSISAPGKLLSRLVKVEDNVHAKNITKSWRTTAIAQTR